MKAILFVFLGGGVGSVLRYLVGILLPSSGQSFPWKTFVANIVGCFLLGLFTHLLPQLLPQQGVSTETKLLLTTGLCGGFTTFSTFSVESVQLLNEGNTTMFLLYISSSILFGLAAAYIGFLLTR